MNDFARKVIEQMNKYGFTAPDMTVTEFVEDILLTISKTESVECEDCISRESACQKMMEMYKEDCEMYGVEIPECFDGHRAVRALMELPPVTPKQGPFESDEAAKRLNDLIFDVNPAEICSQIESDNLINWCKTIQTEMKMAMVQLPCWAERRTDGKN